MQKVIYLSGPMTGLPEFNYPTFHAHAARLRAEGHTVYNPAEYQHDGGPVSEDRIREVFAEYCKFICLEATSIYLLPGWVGSRGATAEYALAVRCGIEIVEI